MPRLNVLLRILLVVTFCLEGRVSVWAASAMAVDSGHQVPAVGQARRVAIDEECADEALSELGGAVHMDLDSAQGLGCACVWVFPVIAFAPTIAFAAQHSLAIVHVVRARLPVAVAATTPVFRHPIG